MPHYDYTCEKCNHKCEVFQKITEEPLKVCPECKQASLRRGPGGGIGLSFTGTGWYKTDYAENPSAAPSKEGSCCPCGKEKNSCSKETSGS